MLEHKGGDTALAFQQKAVLIESLELAGQHDAIDQKCGDGLTQISGPERSL